MKLCDANPFLRYCELQPWVLSNIPPRKAYDYRIFYVLDGRANFILEDRKFPLSPGTVLYFRPGTPYSFDGQVKAIVLNFDMTRNQSKKTEALSPLHSLKHFDPALIFENDPPEELGDFIVLHNAFDLGEKAEECLRHHAYPSPTSDACTSALIKQMLCTLARKTGDEGEEVPETVQRVLLWLRENYDGDLSNEAISARFGYHAVYLNRLFKTHTGMTLHQAVTAERIALAKRLLSGTALPVAAVAEAAGFSDRSQFCTLFRKRTGCTPNQYRKAAKTNG